jgi:hypothetical protein
VQARCRYVDFSSIMAVCHLAISYPSHIGLFHVVDTDFVDAFGWPSEMTAQISVRTAAGDLTSWASDFYVVIFDPSSQGQRP